MTAERHGVAAKVIATVDDLDRIAADDEADVPAMKGWRRELFGEKALALKHGKLALAVEQGPRGDGGKSLSLDHRLAADQPRELAQAVEQPLAARAARNGRASVSTSLPRLTCIGVFGSTPPCPAVMM